MKKEDFGPVVAPEVIKDMDWEEALEWMIKPHNRNLLEEKPYVIYAGADTIMKWNSLWEKKWIAYLLTGQFVVDSGEMRGPIEAYCKATIPEGEEYKLKVEAPKKKEKPHPEFGG